MEKITSARPVKSFVMRTGHFTGSQKKAYYSLSEKYTVPFSLEHINFCSLFGNENPVCMEIGFGMGTATAKIAMDNKNINYLGIEVHKPGIGKLLNEIEKNEITNIRIIEYDAADVIEKMIPLSSLSAVHIFFPDPWPKKRHYKRRLIQRPFTDILVKALKPDGYLYFVTDWENYASWALEQLSNTPGLENAYLGYARAQEWRPKTEFEIKGIKKNHEIKELFFKRKNNHE